MLYSNGMIPEGRSFLEHPDGFICLDCGKVTNQGHKGRVNGRDPTSPSNASSSTDPHPVFFNLKVNLSITYYAIKVWSRACLCQMCETYTT